MDELQFTSTSRFSQGEFLLLEVRDDMLVLRGLSIFPLVD